MGGVLADDMGLGKTLQVLCILQMRKQTGPALVVVPTSLLANWQQEADKFAQGLTVHLYYGPDRHGLLGQGRRRPM